MDTYYPNASHHGLEADTSTASLSFGEKRKHADDEIDDGNINSLAEYCRQVRIVLKLTDRVWFPAQNFKETTVTAMSNSIHFLPS